MTTTQKLQKRLNDSKAARWTALIIVSFTMMMAYFFTDVMGPLEAPLTNVLPSCGQLKGLPRFSPL